MPKRKASVAGPPSDLDLLLQDPINSAIISAIVWLTDCWQQQPAEQSSRQETALQLLVRAGVAELLFKVKASNDRFRETIVFTVQTSGDRDQQKCEAALFSLLPRSWRATEDLKRGIMLDFSEELRSSIRLTTHGAQKVTNIGGPELFAANGLDFFQLVRRQGFFGHPLSIQTLKDFGWKFVIKEMRAEGETPPTTKTDGPILQGTFVYLGKCADNIPPGPWRLLKFMFDRDEATVDEAYQAAVVDHAKQPTESAVKGLLIKANAALLETGFPKSLNKLRGTNVIKWSE